MTKQPQPQPLRLPNSPHHHLQNCRQRQAWSLLLRLLKRCCGWCPSVTPRKPAHRIPAYPPVLWPRSPVAPTPMQAALASAATRWSPIYRRYRRCSPRSPQAPVNRSARATSNRQGLGVTTQRLTKSPGSSTAGCAPMGRPSSLGPMTRDCSCRSLTPHPAAKWPRSSGGRPTAEAPQRNTESRARFAALAHLTRQGELARRNHGGRRCRERSSRAAGRCRSRGRCRRGRSSRCCRRWACRGRSGGRRRSRCRGGRLSPRSRSPRATRCRAARAARRGSGSSRAVLGRQRRSRATTRSGQRGAAAARGRRGRSGNGRRRLRCSRGHRACHGRRRIRGRGVVGGGPTRCRWWLHPHRGVMTIGAVDNAVRGLAYDVEIQLARGAAARGKGRGVHPVGRGNRPQHRVVVGVGSRGEPGHHRDAPADRSRGGRRLPQRPRRLERDRICTGLQTGDRPHLAASDIGLRTEGGLSAVVGHSGRGPDARPNGTEREQTESQCSRRLHR